jgi:hypothetical protein
MKVTVQLLALLPHILQGPDAYIGLKYGYNKFILCFSQFLKTNSEATSN